MSTSAPMTESSATSAGQSKSSASQNHPVTSLRQQTLDNNRKSRHAQGKRPRPVGSAPNRKRRHVEIDSDVTNVSKVDRTSSKKSKLNGSSALSRQFQHHSTTGTFTGATAPTIATFAIAKDDETVVRNDMPNAQEHTSSQKPVGPTFTAYKSAVKHLGEAKLQSQLAFPNSLIHKSRLETTKIITRSNANHRRQDSRRQTPPGRARIPLSADKFRKGMIITAPWHATAMHPNPPPGDDRFVQSKCALICSERRMYIVMFSYDREAILGLPLYSSGDQGLKDVAEELKIYRICLKDRKDNHFQNQSPNNQAAEVAEMKNAPIGPSSSVDLLGGTVINMKEDIKFVGRMTRDGFKYVFNKWRRECQRAEQNTPTVLGGSE